MDAEITPPLTVRGPLRRADLPGLASRVCAALGTQAGRVLVCDVAEVTADVLAVEALCQLQLVARRNGSAVRLRNASPELLDLVAVLGLADLFRTELVNTGG